ncbi:MAG: valine--tRNA ligase [Robiginitomaculum sp.]|nr:MAG: valine--tRNA ligase [Robiginitomaculum sp.]
MLDKSFNPQDAEQRIYKRWEDEGAFKPKYDPELEPYSIVIPPPNVTGSLHMGHALNVTLQDVLIRFERMRGKDVLWQPGMDHAGIATQMVVERQMAEEGSIGRKDMSREDFVERVWKWKEESGGTIQNQTRRLGASCDWSRSRFTMDEGLSDGVVKVFVKLHEEGLIYRDKRLVNWDPKFQTAISNLEVEQREVNGHFWHFKYKLEGGETYEYVEKDEEGNITLRETHDYISIATTRPETMLGDGAVAVNPSDERYASIVGKRVMLPLADRYIPIITDRHADPEKGSGAVKITGAHDFNDYEVAKRNNLPLYVLMDESAVMIQSHDVEGNDVMPAKYVGMDRFEARKHVVADIDALGLLEKVEDKLVQQPFGDRSGVVIEPMLTDQWYVNAKELAKEAIEAVDDGRTKFVPSNWKKTYDMWMHDIEPWCISRQLWWGHRVPAWYGPDGHIFVKANEAEAQAQADQHYGKTVELNRDEDVLDTWFSSGLWPFATMGWPEETEDLKRFYPTSVVVTAFDIIFFWIARMMMQGLHLVGDVPFKTVYIHAIVRDEHGKKMSKSKGNVVDPLDLVEKYGADALRFTLSAMAAMGRDIRLSEQRIEGYRNFGTKLWNVSKFNQMNGCLPVAGFDPKSCTQMVNKWIVGEAKKAVDEVTRNIENYRFNDAADAAYKFAWGQYCDWYVELVKPIMMGEDEAAKVETRACAAWALDQILKILHPFMPYITEELWNEMAKDEDGNGVRDTMLITAEWPVLDDSYLDTKAEADIAWLIKLISEVRSVRSEMNVPPAAKGTLVLIGASETTIARMETYAGVLERMARMSTWEIADAAPEASIQCVVDEATIALPLAGMIDLGAERTRLDKEIGKIALEIEKIDKKLANKNFTDRAPESVVAEQHSRREAFSADLEKLQQALQNLPA